MICKIKKLLSLIFMTALIDKKILIFFITFLFIVKVKQNLYTVLMKN